MIKVLALVGESGCGKTSITNVLKNAGMNILESYTTRKRRTPYEVGHKFVDLEALERHKQYYNVVAINQFDENYYWTIMSQFISYKINVYVVDVPGLQQLKLNDQFDVLSIYIQADEQTRYRRMMFRDDFDIEKRINHDREAFRIIPADYVVHNNNNIFDTYQDIINILEAERWI